MRVFMFLFLPSSRNTIANKEKNFGKKNKSFFLTLNL